MKFQHVNNDSMKITKYEGRTYVRDLVFSYLMKGVCRRIILRMRRLAVIVTRCE